MPTIENHAEHAFHFPKPTTVTGKGIMDVTPSAFEEAILFPRAGNPGEDGNPVPSRTNITAEQLAALKAHPVAKGWLNRRGLAVAAKDSEDVAPAEENALGHLKAKSRQ